MGFEMKGMKGLEKQLKRVGKEAKKEVDGKVSLIDLFSNDFLKKNTDFNTFESFIEDLPVKLKEQKDLDNLDKSKVDPFIKEKTKYNSWDDFAQAAANRHAKKKLDNLFK